MSGDEKILFVDVDMNECGGAVWWKWKSFSPIRHGRMHGSPNRVTNEDIRAFEYENRARKAISAPRPERPFVYAQERNKWIKHVEFVTFSNFVWKTKKLNWNNEDNEKDKHRQYKRKHFSLGTFMNYFTLSTEAPFSSFPYASRVAFRMTMKGFKAVSAAHTKKLTTRFPRTQKLMKWCFCCFLLLKLTKIIFSNQTKGDADGISSPLLWCRQTVLEFTFLMV